MSALLLLGLLILAFLCLMLKKYMRSFVFLTLFTALSVLIGSGYITQRVLDSIQIHKPLSNFEWKTNNVIVLLGGGAVKWNDELRSQSLVYARLHEAARLYFECKSKNVHCTILPTGGDPLKLGKSEADVMAAELINLNVQASDIMIECNSRNTFENAKFSSAILKQKSFDTVVLVTSATHMLRSTTLFTYFGIATTPAPADHLQATDSWKYLAKNFFFLDIALHEYGGLLQFYIILSKQNQAQ